MQLLKIEPLIPTEFSLLMAESQQEGFNIVQRLVEDYLKGINCFDKPGEGLFGAYETQTHLVGVGGLNYDPYSQNPGVGRVRRLYVAKSYRRAGVGRLLIEAIIQAARPHYKILVVRTNNPEADQFYRKLGFSAAPGFENASHFLNL